MSDPSGAPIPQTKTSVQRPAAPPPVRLPHDADDKLRELPDPPRPRPRAEPYRSPQQRNADLRRFASDDPLDWFHTATHRVDLLVRPVLAAITVMINIVLAACWGIGDAVADMLGIQQPSRRSSRSTPPSFQPGSPAITLLAVGLVLLVVGGVAKPFVLPERVDPRSFSTGGSTARLNPSDPTRAVNIFQRFVGNIVGALSSSAPAAPAPQPLSIRAPGDHDLRGAPTVTAEQIDRILESYGSPATGSGAAWVAMGQKYDIDPAYAVAFFIHESSAGTNPGWAGFKNDGSTTHNIGNIICAGYSTCYGRFRDYPSWEAGVEDWYRLIAVEYIDGRGTTTVDQIVPIYAPSFENDVSAYVGAVTTMVDGWRTGQVP